MEQEGRAMSIEIVDLIRTDQTAKTEFKERV